MGQNHGQHALRNTGVEELCSETGPEDDLGRRHGQEQQQRCRCAALELVANECDSNGCTEDSGDHGGDGCNEYRVGEGEADTL